MIVVMIEAEDFSGTVARVEECDASVVMTGRTSAINAMRMKVSDAMVAVVLVGSGQVCGGQE